MNNLVDELRTEIERCKELKKIYIEIGSPGVFGLAFINSHLSEAELVMQSMEASDMMKSLVKLRECE